MKYLKIIVFAVGTYYILKFLIHLYRSRQKMHSDIYKSKKKSETAGIKKPMVNPDAGEFTDYEEVKD